MSKTILEQNIYTINTISNTELYHEQANGKHYIYKYIKNTSKLERCLFCGTLSECNTFLNGIISSLHYIEVE